MKKYFIVVTALAFLAACNGKVAKDTPVLVEDNNITVAEVTPATPSKPKPPVVKAKQVKPVNMRDSLKIDSKKGAVIQKKYKGTVPAADGPGIVYELTLYYQQDSNDGVYELDATYLEAENGKDQTFTSIGKRQVKKGTPANVNAVVYELIPNDGGMVFHFQAEGDSLTMLNQELQKATSDLNYTLKLVQ